MILKWWNRDEFSDVDLRRAEGAANKLLGKKEQTEPWGWSPAPQWAKDAKDDDLRREEQG